MIQDPFDGRTFAFKSENPAGALLCGCCLRSAATLKTDKKGRPYLTCAYCMSRTFIGSDAGLTALRVLQPEMIRAIQQAAAGAAAGVAAEGRSAPAPQHDAAATR